MKTTTTRQPEEPSNELLASLPRRVRQKLPPLESVYLRSGTILYDADQQAEYVYFLDGALVSILSLEPSGDSVEIGLVGHEGLIGVPAILGGAGPFRAVVQKDGNALRATRRALMDEFHRNRDLQDVLLRYANLFMIQVAQSSLCNCFHTLQERLCRWMLIARDAGGSDTLPVTHDLIARLLCTRRASITVNMGLLQRAGLIRTARGQVTILDPRGLQQMSCGCYLIMRDGRRAHG